MDKNLNILGDLVHHMKYAKYDESRGRRETYDETVDRNQQMHVRQYPKLRKEIVETYKLVRDKKVIPSMRSMQFAGVAIDVNPSRIFNCSYLPVTSIDAFNETMFLLLSGCGVGYSVQRHHVEQLPEIRKPIASRRYLIQDSIEGWADAVKVLMRSYFADRSLPLFDYRAIREKGAQLVISGGKAPGPDPLRKCLNTIQTVLERKQNGDKLSTLEAHDIQCIIADAVLAGGIRRSALISLFSIGDDDMMKCKSIQDAEIDEVIDRVNGSIHVRVNVNDTQKTVWIPEDDYNKLEKEQKLQWFYLYPERARSNNSIVMARSLITEDVFKQRWEVIQSSGSGEPGLYFTNNVELGTNPCCEISLNAHQFCNLTSINVSNLENQEDLNERAKAAAFLGTLQASYTDFHYLRAVWKKITEKEALLGVSLTGIASINVLDYDFTEAANVVVDENERVAGLLGINPAKRVTCIKPEGTGSLVLGTSSGIHAWHNHFYKRRIRVGKNEAIYEYLKKELPELVEDEVFGNGAVITVPVRAPEEAITRDEDVIAFLERIKYFTEVWVKPGHKGGMNTHNVSATVSIKSNEWDKVSDWLWDNHDSFNGLSFLPYDNGTYVQAPFEDITIEEFDKFSQYMKTIDLKDVLEIKDNTDLQNELACAGGVCEVF
jgi:ribonucleoside-diphosphate reductase alpha chain